MENDEGLDLMNSLHVLARKALKVWWCAVLTLPLMLLPFDAPIMVRNVETFGGITWQIVGENLLLIAVVIATAAALCRSSSVMKWTWLSLFSKEGKDAGVNLNLAPARVPYFGVGYLLLFMAQLPYFARFEEELFRAGTTDWRSGVLLSLAFGLTHCIAGVPLGAGLAISLAGLWFTRQFFVGGVDLSTIHHTTYNLILCSVLLVISLLAHLEPEDADAGAPDSATPSDSVATP